MGEVPVPFHSRVLRKIALEKLGESESQYFEFIEIVYKTLHLNIRNLAVLDSLVPVLIPIPDITFNK